MDLLDIAAYMKDAGDETLFAIAVELSRELTDRVTDQGLLDRVDPERLGLFPVGLVNALTDVGRLYSIEKASDKFGLPRQTLYNGIASKANPLEHLPVGPNRTIITKAWFDKWRVVADQRKKSPRAASS